MHKSAPKCNETIGKWYKNKHGASKIIDTFQTYQLSSNFFGAIAEEKEDFCKGSLSLPIFFFIICFAYFLYFIFACIFLSKIKKLVPL
jgi:hypothetical protein